MNKLKASLGYILAALMLPLAIISLIGMEPIGAAIVDATGLKISPWFTGGEVARTITQPGYETRIHRPVFDGLIGEQREGFVQVVWSPVGSLPETVDETIDFDANGTPDFSVTLHPRSKTAEWQALTSQPYGMDGPYAIGEGMGVRIKLHNK